MERKIRGRSGFYGRENQKRVEGETDMRGVFWPLKERILSWGVFLRNSLGLKKGKGGGDPWGFFFYQREPVGCERGGGA